MNLQNKQVRVALIGAGGMGKRWAWAIRQTPQIHLTAVVDTDIKRAETVAQDFKGCHPSTNWKRTLERKDIQAAIVVVPHKWLAPISRFALMHGKHVLCEKPGALNTREIIGVLQEAKKSRRRYMIGFNSRFFPGPATVKKLYDQRVIGKLLFIRARFGFGGRMGYEKEWRHKKEVSGGGILIDQGVHIIDLVRWFMGDVKVVGGLASQVFWKSKVEDNGFLLFENSKRQTAFIHVSWTQWDPMFSFEIYGEKGYIKVEGLGRKYGGSERVIIGLRDPNLKELPKEKVIECNPDADQALVKELKEFLLAIRQRRQPKPGIQDALEVLKIVEGVYRNK